MASPHPDDDKLRSAVQAAQSYYVQHLTMDAIAHELGTSRSTVSRLLSYARDTGLVEIQIHSPLDRASSLEHELGRRFGVTAHVVPVPEDLRGVHRLERVATVAARVLGRFVGSTMVVGVAWGSTMSAVSRHLASKATHDSVVVQLNGAANDHTTGIEYASEILQRFGTAFSATVQQFPVPAFFDDPSTRDAMWRERSTRRVLGIQARMGLAVFGVGSLVSHVPSRVHAGGYLDDEDYRSLRADGAVGDIATVFFRRDGTSDGIRLNARATGPDLDRLCGVSRRVCVAAGPEKEQAVRGALAAGLVTDLVLDAGLAHRLTTDQRGTLPRAPG